MLIHFLNLPIWLSIFPLDFINDFTDSSIASSMSCCLIISISSVVNAVKNYFYFISTENFIIQLHYSIILVINFILKYHNQPSFCFFVMVLMIWLMLKIYFHPTSLICMSKVCIFLYPILPTSLLYKTWVFR